MLHPNVAVCIAHLVLAKPVVRIEHPPLCGPGAPVALVSPVAQGGMTCVPTRLHTKNVQHENSTGQTSCAASAMGNTPKNILSTRL